jgi:hypothetical protein
MFWSPIFQFGQRESNEKEVKKTYMDIGNGQKFELWELEKSTNFWPVSCSSSRSSLIVSLAATSSSSNEFITCFSRILNLRIYEFFSQNFLFHFLETCKVFFSVMINSSIGIFDHKRKLLPCTKIKQRKFCEIFCRFVDWGIVKKCDELDLMLHFWNTVHQ